MVVRDQPGHQRRSRRLVPHQNATTMQVAVLEVVACLWMFENPRRGLCVSDDLPHDFVLGFSKPYLGKFVSVASDWTPLKHYSNIHRQAATTETATCMVVAFW